MKTRSKLIPLLAALGAASSCGGHEQKSASATPASQRAEQLSVLEVPVVFFSGSPAKARIGGEWHWLKKSRTGVSELVAGPRGSVLRIGEAKLWMRSGSHLKVGQDAHGKLVVDLLSGQARVKAMQGMVLGQDTSRGLAGRDMLLSHRGQETRLFETRLRPRNAAWSLELERPAEARGVGALEAGRGESMTPLALRRLSVKVGVHGGMAITEVEHVFYNDADEQREGTFRFPAPDGAMVTGLAMEIDGALMEGEFVERAKARKVYEKIVDEMQDPALLEWQQGGWFKLRVFPIEAKSEKRVVLRYAAPLQRGAEGFEYRYLATPPELSKVERFELSLNGQKVSEAKDLEEAKDVVLTFPDSAMPAAVAEDRNDYSYRALQVTPAWQDAPQPLATARNRRVVLALDSSRSALENRELSLEVLEMVLSELGPKDQFAVFAHDIAPREDFMGFLPANAKNRDRALEFYRSLELDGASDIGATLKYAAQLAKGKRNAQVIYVGDGTPSWGLTSEEELQREAKALGKTPLFAAVLGRGASIALWKNLSGAKGGTVIRPHSAMEARKLAFFMSRAPQMPRMESASIASIEGVDIFPKEPRTLFYGESMTVLLRAPKDKMPSALTMQGRMGGAPIRTSVALDAKMQPASLVAKRWASREIARMERESVDKDLIVGMSQEFGLLSKHTSLLVLESEEAYRQHEIERKNAKAQQLAANAAAPQVSGGDLDNLNGQEASLSPDHIQPGDPEVRIPAPADARSVVLVFPFGDTKIAHWDREQQTWIARFLIDTDTLDGRYWVRVNIEHADGQMEQLKLPYTVDTTPPDVSVRVVRLKSNRFRLVVRQNGTDRESATALDASRVEVQLPWGEMRRIYRKELGLFRRVVRAPEPLGETLSLRIVVTDEALNQRVLELDAPVVLP